ncbi:MAG: hypothetical protein ACLP5H_23365 [Desulfomonilaceae bacterium]
MNPDHDSSRYYIEDTLLLKFLITRFTEMLQIKEPRLVPVWAGLSLVALHQNKELANAFEILISSDSYSVEEALTISIDLFMLELDRLDATDTSDYVEKRVERRPLSRRTERKFQSWAWHEGRRIKKEQDFRFYGVWELISWLALTSDEYIKAFEEKCRFSEAPTQEKLRHGLDILKAATFKRPIDNISVPPDLLKTGTTPIDMEISK